MRYPTTLTIAGSDCSGGAGIQADIKTMSALGCFATSAVTSVTVQNTLGVAAVQAIRPEIVAGQINAVFSDIRPDAVKIGMVNDCATIEAIADELARHNCPTIIVDPVMVATSGSRLMQDDAVETFRRRLMPMATLLTPNIPEAEVLAGMEIKTDADCDKAGTAIAQAAGCDVLIKGGHRDGSVKEDRLYGAGGRKCSLQCSTVATANTHGTGCTLSSAIAACMAKGMNTEEAIKAAKDYVTEALKAGADVEIGHGHGPVNHFFRPEELKATKQ